MNKIRLHIAFFLLALFTTPVIYKTVHVFVSHSDQLKGKKKELIVGNTNTSSQKANFKTFDRCNHCPICNYVFQINNLPEKQNSKNILIWEYITQQQRPEKIFLHIYSNPANNRAPPQVS